MSGVRHTVTGYWVGTEERYADFFDAATAYDAEEAMLARARAESDEFRIAGTLEGEYYRADTYTAFIDPQDPENDSRIPAEDRAPDEELEPAEWTVLGVIIGTRRWRDRVWNRNTGGERYLGHHMAVSALAAEGVAQAEVGDREGLKLAVCAVLRGHRYRAEGFPYADHDRKAD